jgi:hypothetical protein
MRGTLRDISGGWITASGQRIEGDRHRITGTGHGAPSAV